MNRRKKALLYPNYVKESVVDMMQNEKKTSRFRFSAARAAVIALSGLMLGVCIYILIASVSAGNRMPMPFGFGAGVVLSGSMEPELGVNDLIIVRKADQYSVGDVVVYRSGRMSVVHRIVSADGKTVVTKGDANNTTDDPISPSDISGRVIGAVPRAGAAVDFVRSPFGVILILGAAILLLELSFRSEKRKGQRDIEQLRAEIEGLKNKVRQESSDA